jgi:putative thioredoxin
MSAASGSSAVIYDVTDATFERDVLIRSRETPVLVDFWAPWCGPCLMLGPVIERVVEEQAGAILLAKLNTDENQLTAHQYGIRGIPNVKAFVDGRVADEFQGAIPEPQVRAFVARIAPSGKKAVTEEVTELIEAGDYEKARTLLDGVPSTDPAFMSLDPWRARIDLLETAAGLRDVPTLEAAVAADPTDYEAAVELATRRAAAGDTEGALAGLLDVVRHAPAAQKDAARARMLTIFRTAKDPASMSGWQRELASALY